MNLETFICESLVQLARGVKAASDQVVDSGAYINPSGVQRFAPAGYASMKRKDGRLVGLEEVEFDIAVTVSEESQQGGRAGIQVVSIFGLGGEAKAIAGQRSESRIKFKVPIALPLTLQDE